MKCVGVLFVVMLCCVYLEPTEALVGCNQCGPLNVRCLSKSSVISCISGIQPIITRCPTGTYCDVNKLPWCHKDYRPLC